MLYVDCQREGHHKVSACVTEDQRGIYVSFSLSFQAFQSGVQCNGTLHVKNMIDSNNYI